MNYYSHHIGDYAAHTTHLTLLEHGVYRRLIDIYYLTESAFSDDLPAICRKVGARTEEEKLAVDTVLTEFFVLTESGYTQRRCEAELTAFAEKSSKASDSANRRWKKSDAKAMPTQCEGNANAMPTHSERNAKAMPTQCDDSSERITVAMLTNNHKPITNNQEPLKTKDSAEAPNYLAKDDLLQSGVDEQTATDWLALRKAKKAPVSKTAMDAIKREVAIAGLPLGSALVLCCERGWASFKAEWVHPQRSRQSSAAPMDLAAAQRAATEEGRRRLFGDIDEMVTIDA